MLFSTLMKVLPDRVKDQQGTLKRITSVAPPSGIKIHGVYFLLGRYDGAILFEAPDLRTAKDFILRATTQTYTTETLSALPAEEL